MPPIQFGLLVPPGHNFFAGSTPATYPADLNRCLDLIADYFDSAWWIDHIQWRDWDILECWTAISYLAGRYRRLRFGTMVLSQNYRNPALLAKMAATFDYVTEGRLILGLGAGWKEDEYRAYGYEFPPPGVRVGQLEEALAIVRSMWTEAETTLAGRYYRVEGARCDPKPATPPPLMVGARGPRMMRVTARHADWWNGDWSGLEQYRALIGQLDAACRAVGRDPTTLRKTWLGTVACRRTEAEARAEVASSYASGAIRDNSLVGTPAQVVEQVRAYAALGVDYVILCPHHFPDLASLELFCHEVIPVLRA